MNDEDLNMDHDLKEFMHLINSSPTVEPAARARMIIAAARRKLRLGPVVVYSLDWRTRTPGTRREDYPQYSPWIMDRVQILAPMFGIMPRKVSEWLVGGGDSVSANSKGDHAVKGGRPDGFWERENIAGYLKLRLNEGKDYIIYNRCNNAGPFQPDDISQLEEISILLEPIIAQGREMLPTSELRERDTQIMREINGVYQSLQGRMVQQTDGMLAELLQAAYRIFAAAMCLERYTNFTGKRSGRAHRACACEPTTMSAFRRSC